MLSPTFFSLGPITIRWYGVFAALGFLAGYWYAKRIATHRKLSLPLDDIIFKTAIGGLIGARLYHVINELPMYLARPAEIIAIWHGGLAIHGAVIGGALTLFWIAKRDKLSFLKLADVLMPALILGQAIGRWGNFFNQELFGRPTNLPWGIFIDPSNRPLDYANFTRFHPTFFYEFLWNALAVAVLTLWIKKRAPKQSGIIFGAALIISGLGRLLTEMLRIDAAPLVAGTRLSLLVSIGIIIIGTLVVALRINKKVEP